MYPPTPDLLKNLHFPVHSSAQGPPRGLCPATQVSKCQNLQRPRLRTRNRRVRRGIGLLERLLEQPCERLLFQRGTRLAKQLAIQVQTQVPTQVAIQVSIHRTTRRGIRGDIRRETQGTFRRAFQRALSRVLAAATAVGRKGGSVARLLSRGQAPTDQGGFASRQPWTLEKSAYNCRRWNTPVRCAT